MLLVIKASCPDSGRADVMYAACYQVVMETAGVNTFVSGPAAAMALMMMYLKTHDAGVAAKFKVCQLSEEPALSDFTCFVLLLSWSSCELAF